MKDINSNRTGLWESMPFGKFKGEPLWVALTDARYCTWALMQPGLWATYPETMAALERDYTHRDFEAAVRSVKREACRNG